MSVLEWTVGEIARASGVPVVDVRRIMTEEAAKAAHALRAEGHSAGNIAWKFNVTERTIRRWFAEVCP